MRGFFAKSKLQVEGGTLERGLPKCGSCGFFKHCSSPRMAPAGAGTTGVLFLGEHPGDEDDRLGKHFAGEGGRALREVLGSFDQRLLDSSLSFSLICAPGTRDVTDKNVEACRPSVLRTIDELKPKVIVLLGPWAVRSVIPAERGGAVGAHDRWLGHAIPSLQHRAWLCPTWSPAQVLRYGKDPVVSKLWASHLERAFQLVDAEPRAYSFKELWARVDVVTSPRLARARLRDLGRKEGVLAFDYESNCLKPEKPRADFAAVSFCLDGEDTFSLPLRRKDDRLLRLLAKVLRNERLRKVASNAKHEERWSRFFLGSPVAGWDWDTLIAAHLLDNRGKIGSIKFQSFLRFGVPDYDRFVEPFFKEDEEGYNRVFDMDLRDLLNYNGLDSLLEYMVSVEQKKELGFRG